MAVALAALLPSGAAQPSPGFAILLLGDSRDRYVFDDQLLTSCSAESARRGETTKKKLRWPSPTCARLAKPHEKSCGRFGCAKHRMNGSAACSFGVLGHVDHYGVAPDGAYNPIAWSTHAHYGWNGAGFDEASADTDIADDDATGEFRRECRHFEGRAVIRGHELILEAVERFAACVPSDLKLRVVFSSMLWDMARHCLCLPDEPYDAWAATLRTNYTLIARRLAETVASHGGKLFLTTGYLPREDWYCIKASPLSYARHAASVARGVAPTVGARLIDLQRLFGTFARGDELLRDDRHANERGRAMQWAAIAQAVMTEEDDDNGTSVVGGLVRGAGAPVVDGKEEREGTTCMQ